MIAVGKSSQRKQTKKPRDTKRNMDRLIRLFMTKGPLDTGDTVAGWLLSTKKFRNRKERLAYYIGVYELLLFLSVISDDHSPGEVSRILDGLAEDCERELAGIRRYGDRYSLKKPKLRKVRK